MSNEKLTRTMTGKVVADTAQKTISVLVVYSVKHKIGKYIKKHKKIQAHDENQQAKIGDTVIIEECRPISKTKSWRLVSVAKAGEVL